MNRFKEPCGADEFGDCLGCNRSTHHTGLDESGLCEHCRPAPEFCSVCGFAVWLRSPTHADVCAACADAKAKDFPQTESAEKGGDNDSAAIA